MRKETNMYFRKNKTFIIGENETFIVEDLLGEGGQGEVYLVRNDSDGERYALRSMLLFYRMGCRW